MRLVVASAFWLDGKRFVPFEWNENLALNSPETGEGYHTSLTGTTRTTGKPS